MCSSPDQQCDDSWKILILDPPTTLSAPPSLPTFKLVLLTSTIWKAHRAYQHEYDFMLCTILHNVVKCYRRALPIDVARGQLSGQPMCMEQYYRLLNSYRIPGHQVDSLVTFQSSDDVPQHIVVACNNQVEAECDWKTANSLQQKK